MVNFFVHRTQTNPPVSTITADCYAALDNWRHSCPLLERKARDKAVREITNTIQELNNTPARARLGIVLDLSGLHVTDINWGPSVYKELKDLYNLFLNKTRISYLPENIRLCNSLNMIECNNSHLRELPDYLSDCSQLKSIEVCNSGLQLVSPRIFSLPLLHTLKINNNNIHSLPEVNIYGSMLMEVDIRKNKIEKLPDFIKKLGPDIVSAEGNTVDTGSLFL